MGNETIIYYIAQDKLIGEDRVLPRLLQNKKTGRYFLKKAQLPFFKMEQDNLTIYAVMIPGKYQTWKKEKLLRIMSQTQKQILQYAKADEKTVDTIILHPQIRRIFQIESEELTTEFLFLTNQILNWLWNRKNQTFESIVLLLGKEVFPEVQMRYFTQMMQPFFSKINRLLIVYEADPEEQQRWREAIGESTQDFYYEYGLMAQIAEKSGITKNTIYRGRDRQDDGQRNQPVLFLDYGVSERIPVRWVQSGDTYLDVNASEKKETFLTRKCAEVFYLSPLKYLDTAVKSGYDKLVHLCK